MKLRVRFFKKIQDWILKSARIWKRILRFFTEQINPRSLGSWPVKGTEESTSRVDSSVPLRHHDPGDLGLICLVKKRKISFRILSDLKIQSWIFLKKRTLRKSNHKLNIETSRYDKISRCDRIFPVCGLNIKDEIDFPFYFPNYLSIRDEFLIK